RADPQVGQRLVGIPPRGVRPQQPDRRRDDQQHPAHGLGAQDLAEALGLRPAAPREERLGRVVGRAHAGYFGRRRRITSPTRLPGTPPNTLTAPSVVRAGAQPLDRRPARLGLQPPALRPRGGPGGPALRRIGPHGLPQRRGEPLASGLAVAQLAAVLGGHDGEHAVDEATAEPAQRALAQRLGHRRRAGEVERQLHPRVGGVHALAPGPGRPGEAPTQLPAGQHQRASHREVGFCHLPRMPVPSRVSMFTAGNNSDILGTLYAVSSRPGNQEHAMALSQTPEAGSRRIARPVPLRESVYSAILDMIVSRQLQPGQHLVESELAMMLGVSRQPVREALQWLKNDGWVDLRPGLGAFVHTPTVEEADQLLAVRSLLETESARLAATNATEEGVAHLRELCERGKQALAAEDVGTLVELNAELH